jgi:hypothetical protein
LRTLGPLATEWCRSEWFRDGKTPRTGASALDKKDLAAIVTNLVEAVQREQNVPEGMARALVGFALMKNTEALVASIKNPAGAVQG